MNQNQCLHTRLGAYNMCLDCGNHIPPKKTVISKKRYDEQYVRTSCALALRIYSSLIAGVDKDQVREILEKTLKSHNAADDLLNAVEFEMSQINQLREEIKNGLANKHNN